MYGETDVKIPLDLLKLFNLGMKLPSGSEKHKEVLKKIEVLRKKYNIKEQDKEKAQSDTMADREKVKDLEFKKRLAILQAKIAKDQETLAKMQIADKQSKDRKKDESVNERELTGGEKKKLKDLEKEVPKKDFIDRYGKEEGESIYYATLTKMAKQEGLWDNIRKKKERIARGSGERMRKKGEKGAPTSDQIKRAQESYEIGKDYADHTKEIDPYSAPKSEKIYLRRDRKLPNLKVPVNRRKGKIINPKKEEILDEKIEGLVNKSKQTGVPYSILKKSYDRGMAAWKGGHRPGASQQQWAFARVNSMLTGGKADPDLQKQIKDGGYKKKKKKSESITKESIEEWYSDNETISLYQGRYGDEWLKKLNNTYEAMLSKLDESCCDDCDNLYDHVIMEAEYQGRKVKLNDPFRLPSGSKKKFGVYVKNEKGNIVKVTFGDPNMGINRDDPEARKNFRSRHSCDDNPGPKYKARYWSCYQWRAGAKVDN